MSKAHTWNQTKTDMLLIKCQISASYDIIMGHDIYSDSAVYV